LGQVQKPASFGVLALHFFQPDDTDQNVGRVAGD
jgi:hypothetical protein